MDWLQGKKTYIAAILAALVAANGVLQIVPKETQDALLAVAIALGLYGLHAQAERLSKPYVEPPPPQIPPLP